jgi:hypothetical protein
MRGDGDFRRPSLGLMARPGVPVGGRVRKLRAVEDQSAPIPEKETSELGGSICTSFDARREGYEVERGTFPLDLMQTYCAGLPGLLGVMISRSSISNTNVAPGLIRGGLPLSR